MKFTLRDFKIEFGTNFVPLTFLAKINKQTKKLFG